VGDSKLKFDPDGVKLVNVLNTPEGFLLIEADVQVT